MASPSSKPTRPSKRASEHPCTASLSSAIRVCPIQPREEADRLLSLDEGIVTLGASQPLDPATASSIERARANGAIVVELSADLSAVSRREGLGAPRSVGLGAPRAVLTQLMKQAREAYASVADATRRYE